MVNRSVCRIIVVGRYDWMGDMPIDGLGRYLRHLDFPLEPILAQVLTVELQRMQRSDRTIVPLTVILHFGNPQTVVNADPLQDRRQLLGDPAPFIGLQLPSGPVHQQQVILLPQGDDANWPALMVRKTRQMPMFAFHTRFDGGVSFLQSRLR